MIIYLIVMDVFKVASISSEINVKFVVDAIVATSTLTRSLIELTNQITPLSQKTMLFGKSTHFISVIKLPGSIYSAGISILEIGKVNSLKSAGVYSFIFIKNVSFIGKNVLDLLKGMKAFGLLHERHFWILTPTPFFIAIGSIAFSFNLGVQVLERSRCDKYKKTTQSLGILGSLSKAGGIILLNANPFAKISSAIPAHALLSMSALSSLSKVILSKDHVN